MRFGNVRCHFQVFNCSICVEVCGKLHECHVPKLDHRNSRRARAPVETKKDVWCPDLCFPTNPLTFRKVWHCNLMEIMGFLSNVGPSGQTTLWEPEVFNGFHHSSKVRSPKFWETDCILLLVSGFCVVEFQVNHCSNEQTHWIRRIEWWLHGQLKMRKNTNAPPHHTYWNINCEQGDIFGDVCTLLGRMISYFLVNSDGTVRKPWLILQQWFFGGNTRKTCFFTTSVYLGLWAESEPLTHWQESAARKPVLYLLSAGQTCGKWWRWWAYDEVNPGVVRCSWHFMA